LTRKVDSERCFAAETGQSAKVPWLFAVRCGTFHSIVPTTLRSPLRGAAHQGGSSSFSPVSTESGASRMWHGHPAHVPENYRRLIAGRGLGDRARRLPSWARRPCYASVISKKGVPLERPDRSRRNLSLAFRLPPRHARGFRDEDIVATPSRQLGVEPFSGPQSLEQHERGPSEGPPRGVILCGGKKQEQKGTAAKTKSGGTSSALLGLHDAIEVSHKRIENREANA